MRSELTELEIAQYRLNGFLVLPGFLSDDELAALREATDRLAGPPGVDGLTNYRGNRLAFADEFCADLLLGEAIGSLVAQAEGLRTVRYLTDALSFVLPGHGATPWHINMHEGMPVRTARAVSICIPLDDYRWNTKAMNFLPGTHIGTPVDVSTPSPSLRPGPSRFDQLFDDFPHFRSIEPVTAECPAGSAILANPLGVHGSAPNMSTLTRRALGVVYFEDGELFTGSTYMAPDDGFPDAERGQPLRSRYTPVVSRAPDRET